MMERVVKVGDKIRITSVDSYNGYCVDVVAEALVGKSGVVTSIDDMGQLHGTWGGLAVLPEVDKFEIIDEV